MIKNKITNLTILFIALYTISLPCKLYSINNFKSFVLKNGLTIYVMENNNIPVVIHSVFYKVGSVDEPSNKTGIAHLLEHLMFKGTKKYSSKDFIKTIKTSGGVFNAFTSYDYTGYYEIIPKNILPKIMAMEADRMTNLSITQQVLDVEKQVVKEEKSLRIDRNINSKFFQDYRSVFFKKSPYGHPVIGWSDDFETITLKDVLDFYKEYYSPNNAVVFIAGNISFEEVKNLTNKHYAEVPSNSKVIQHTIPFENNLINNNNYIHANKELKQPLMIRSYLVNSLKSAKTNEEIEQILNYEMISYILSSNSSKLYKYLVNETKLAIDVSVSYNPFSRGNSMFSIIVIPNQNVSLKEIDKSLEGFINNIKQQGLTSDEILTYTNKFRNERIYLKDNPQEFLFFQANLVVNEIDNKKANIYRNIPMHVNQESIHNAINTLFNTPYLNGFLVQDENNY